MNLLLPAFLATVGLSLIDSWVAAIKDTWEFPAGYKKPAQILHKICLAESGAQEDTLSQCMDGTLHNDRGVKCYMHCLFEKTTVLDKATGQIKPERMAPLAPNSDMREAFLHLSDSCNGHAIMEDPCDTAYEAAKCFLGAHDEVVKFCHLLMAD
ncbi:pheromone-binding protein-related protein 6-like [Uranotaenia lowii]|uniref:pheromone-binding protein-related protein 6-like n=1 Tax=Uranotaenia lowii TaxID=190385 RepID=UPI00247AB5EF|nr:pheromone-binding protein-related protein 6-like [Uranotaenia lowii]